MTHPRLSVPRVYSGPGREVEFPDSTGNLFRHSALACWLAADLLWGIGMEIRETALNPACRLLHARVEMALDCDSQNQFGFYLAIIAPFLAFGALVAVIFAIASAIKSLRKLFLCAPLAYHRQSMEWPDSGGSRHELDVIGTAPDDANLRRD
jgi:hypothetical protein